MRELFAATRLAGNHPGMYGAIDLATKDIGGLLERALCRESHSMDSLNPDKSASCRRPAIRPPRVWKFWGTALWGLFIFAAMFLGQLA